MADQKEEKENSALVFKRKLVAAGKRPKNESITHREKHETIQLEQESSESEEDESDQESEKEDSACSEEEVDETDFINLTNSNIASRRATFDKKATNITSTTAETEAD